MAVVLRHRVPSPIPCAFFPGAPDLAVEVLSPDDRPGEVAARIADFLRAGATAVWIVDPERRTFTAHTRGGATRYAVGEVVRGEPPLAALVLSLVALFACLE